MKQKLQLHIPEPCHEDWNNMTETQQGRFCMSCKKEVVDFSVMSDQEILGYISTAGSSICGRVQDSQLNRYIQAPIERKKYPFKYFWSVLITSTLISHKSSGQVLPPKDTAVSIPVDQKPVIIRAGKIAAPHKQDETNLVVSGKVIDEDGNPVAYASIIIKGKKKGTSADSLGAFTLKIKGEPDKIELLVSSAGFIEETVTLKNTSAIKSLDIQNGTIKMEIAIAPLKKAMMSMFVISAPECTRKGKVTGAVWVVKQETIFDKISDKLFGKEITVYPNPIARNGNFRIGFNVKEYGEYILRFTDVLGTVIAIQKLIISSKNQLENFNSDMFKAGGTYFVSIAGKQHSKMFTSKLIVQ